MEQLQFSTTVFHSSQKNDSDSPTQLHNKLVASCLVFLFQIHIDKIKTYLVNI